MNETVTYKDEEFEATIVVRSATVFDGLNRDMMTSDAAEELSKEKSPELTAAYRAMRIVKLTIWPMCMAALVSCQITHTGEEFVVTPETFMELPEPLITGWLDATAKLNPHWVPSLPVNEKKARKRSSG